MKIYQTTPRLVFGIKDKVYKFFETSEECEVEVKAIQSSVLTSCSDPISGYAINFVEFIEYYENHYVMKMVSGVQLSSQLTDSNCALAGRWLRVFHDLSNANGSKNKFLFGDFSISHLYIDINGLSITAIDPGAGFGTIGKPESDIARFVVSLLQSRTLKIWLISSYVSAFMHAYGVQNIDKLTLDDEIKYRVHRNFNKRITLRSGVKNYFRARAVFVNSLVKSYWIAKIINL